MEVVLIGAGGHARVCVDVLHEQRHLVVGALSSDGTATANFPVPMLGSTTEFASVAAAHPEAGWFVAIGDHEARLRWILACRDAGFTLAVACSPSAAVSPNASIGEATLVAPKAVVNAAAEIGVGVIINTAAVIEHDCTIADGAHVAPGAVLGGGVHVGRAALVGLGSRVLPGVRIGAGATVGAGAVVVADVAANATVVGVPARSR
jgi:UDP-perosamine 4-acetyltransferase